MATKTVQPNQHSIENCPNSGSKGSDGCFAVCAKTSSVTRHFHKLPVYWVPCSVEPILYLPTWWLVVYCYVWDKNGRHGRCVGSGCYKMMVLVTRQTLREFLPQHHNGWPSRMQDISWEWPWPRTDGRWSATFTVVQVLLILLRDRHAVHVSGKRFK